MPVAPSLPLASGSFLISPNVGMMIWTIVVFVIVLFILQKAVFPRIGEALDKRAQTIEGEIDAAADLRKEADQVLAEYRERLAEARKQAEEIVQRSRQTAEAQVREAHAEGEARREQLLEQTRKDIEAETRRSIDQIRREVADLTVLATEKVTRKTLTEEDQRRLVEDALSELDFAVLSGDGRS